MPILITHFVVRYGYYEGHRISSVLTPRLLNMPKSKLQKTDGLGPLEIKKIRAALRLVWHRSCARSLVVKRCTGIDGFFVCEKCKEKCPQIRIDHIVCVGEVDGGFINRLFCPSHALQGLCNGCHRAKTKEERQTLGREKAKAKGV